MTIVFPYYLQNIMEIFIDYFYVYGANIEHIHSVKKTLSRRQETNCIQKSVIMEWNKEFYWAIKYPNEV